MTKLEYNDITGHYDQNVWCDICGRQFPIEQHSYCDYIGKNIHNGSDLYIGYNYEDIVDFCPECLNRITQLISELAENGKEDSK